MATDSACEGQRIVLWWKYSFVRRSLCCSQSDTHSVAGWRVESERSQAQRLSNLGYLARSIRPSVPCRIFRFDVLPFETFPWSNIHRSNGRISIIISALTRHVMSTFNIPINMWRKWRKLCFSPGWQETKGGKHYIRPLRLRCPSGWPWSKGRTYHFHTLLLCGGLNLGIDCIPNLSRSKRLQIILNALDVPPWYHWNQHREPNSADLKLTTSICWAITILFTHGYCACGSSSGNSYIVLTGNVFTRVRVDAKPDWYLEGRAAQSRVSSYAAFLSPLLATALFLGSYWSPRWGNSVT